jgi:hypothetical protein
MRASSSGIVNLEGQAAQKVYRTKTPIRLEMHPTASEPFITFLRDVVRLVHWTTGVVVVAQSSAF